MIRSRENLTRVFYAASGFLVSATWGQAHDNAYVHPLITKYAFDAWASTSPGTLTLSDWSIDINTPYAFNGESRLVNEWDGANQVGWLNKGSIYEDTDDGGGERRCLNHFYDPLASEPALNDPAGVHSLSGNRDSYTWATAGAGLTGPNDYTWAHARTKALAAIESGAKADRDSALADAFFILGKVIHLNQDLSQPEHARNDAHCINGEGLLGLWGLLPKWRWIENFGQDACQHINDPKNSALKTGLAAAMPLDWRNSGFNRLKDFWDRNIYDGANAAALDADAASSTQLGLAEFTNGNFLGADATYYDFRPRNKTYPYPRIASTSYEQSPENIPLISLVKVKPIEMQNGAPQKYGLFLEKVKDGIEVKRHSMMLYSKFTESIRRPPVFAQSSTVDSSAPSFTVQSIDVLREYHEILLPKSVSYSAGIIDYFFRGSIGVSSGRDNYNIQTILVTNNSGQVMQGGQFQLISEDANKIRSQGPVVSAYLNNGSQWQADSLLHNGDTVTLRFSKPTSMPSNAVLVYKGTIGLTPEGVPSDPDDIGQALAVKPLSIYSSYMPHPVAQWDTVTATKSKFGFYEHSGYESTPPKRYLKATLSGEMAVANYYDAECTEIAYAYHGGHDASVREYSGVASYDSNGVLTKADGTTWTSGAFNGFGAKPPEYRYDFKIDYISNPAHAESVDDVITASTRTITGKGVVEIVSNWALPGQRAVGTLTEVLSDPYETSALKANTISSLPALDSDWDDSPYAIHDLDNNEWTFKAQRGKYRIRFPLAQQVPANTVYNVSWIERFMPKVGTGITDLEIQSPGLGYTTPPTLTISGAGTGGVNATAVATLDERGAISAVTITNAGQGYKYQPSVTVTGSATIPARIVVHLGTETRRRFTWSGPTPPNYSQYDTNTWPIILDGSNDSFILNEPATNGQIEVSDMTVSYQIPSP